MASKESEMEIIAVLGAVLLLVGCWRGLAPSKRNVWCCLLSGFAVIAFATTPHILDAQLWVLGEGGGGLIAGFALTATGVVLAVRRRRLDAADRLGG